VFTELHCVASRIQVNGKFDGKFQRFSSIFRNVHGQLQRVFANMGGGHLHPWIRACQLAYKGLVRKNHAIEVI
jgi:hypothetical protein